jgi:hypothetical protein
MQRAVQDGGGQDVIVEDLTPVEKTLVLPLALLRARDTKKRQPQVFISSRAGVSLLLVHFYFRLAR